MNPRAPSAPPFMSQSALTHEAAARHLIRYGGEFAPVTIARATGCWLYDTDGRAILDFTSGQMCATLGHSHPRVLEAIGQASREAIHLYSTMLSPPVLQLAERLIGMLPAPLAKVMFLSTGSEANEAALRMAKLSTGGFEVIGFDRSWHGMTAGSSASTYSGGRRGYGPAMPGTLALPTPNAYRCPIRHCRDACDRTCLEVGFEMVDRQSVGAPAAVIAEPILSSGGIIELAPEYLRRLKEMCEERGLLLILDESQTALGRVGSLFAFERSNVVPDFLTLSKTFGAGLPLSATVTTAALEATCHERGFLQYTSHVSDPLPAAVGLAVLEVVSRERLAERASESGAYLKHGLQALGQRFEAVGDVRGQGLLLGLELVHDREHREPWPELAQAVARRCLKLGLSTSLVRAGHGSVFRIAPPLTITREELDTGLSILERALADSLDALP